MMTQQSLIEACKQAGLEVDDSVVCDRANPS